ncbi:hypothetical protein M1D88_19885 [Arthrobacter sp. R1-13]
MKTLHATKVQGNRNDTAEYEALLARYARARKEAEVLAQRELANELKKRRNALWRSVALRYAGAKHSKP